MMMLEAVEDGDHYDDYYDDDDYSHGPDLMRVGGRSQSLELDQHQNGHTDQDREVG